MIELIKNYLKTWRKAPEIMKKLKDQGVKAKNLKNLNRQFRRAAAKYNERYQNGETEYFLAHSTKGYKLTNKPKEIAQSLQDDRKRGLKLLKRYYTGMKSLSEKDQIALLEGDQDLFDIVSKMSEL